MTVPDAPPSGPDVLVVGRHVITDASDQLATVEGGAVLVSGGRVAAIGPAAELRAGSDAVEIGGGDCVVLPGLVNAHHHQAVTPFQRGILDDALEPWLAGQVGLPLLDPRLDTALGAVQMLRSGVTTVLHNHATAWLPPDGPYDAATTIVDTYRAIGMRVAFSVSARDQHPFVYGEPGDRECGGDLPTGPAAPFDLAAHVELVERLHTEQHHGTVRIMVSPHNVQWCTDELLDAQRGLADRLGTGIHLHLQETRHQLAYGHRTWGKSPAAHLADIGFLGDDVSVAHAVWLDAGDARLLAGHGVTVCHNPSSNLRLRSGIADVTGMIEAGVRVALGLDQAGINDDQDLWAELRLAMRLAPVRRPDSPIGAGDVLSMATNGGAAVTGFDGVGTLRVGGPADLVVVDVADLSRPFLHPDHDPVDVVVHRAKPADVRSVMIDGTLRLDEGRLVGVDEQAIIDELTDEMQRSMRTIGLRPGAALAEGVRRWFGS